MDDLDFLIKYMINEDNIPVSIPNSLKEKEHMYRSLVSIRKPKPLSEEFIEKSNKYLQEKLMEKGIIKLSEIEKKYKNICIWQGDITRLEVDAIVNPANHQGLGCFIPSHKCLDNIIGVSAGLELRNECNEIMKNKNYFLQNGEAIITKGYNLPCKYVIHTVGPEVKKTVQKKDEEDLYSCYKNSLDIAKKYNLKTIAFPCISTGIFSYPNDEASKIAIKAVKDYINENNYIFDKIVFCTFTDKDYELYLRNI